MLVVDDDYLSFGIGAEIIATICETLPGPLKCPPQRIAHPDIPIPFTPVMEHFLLPDAGKIESRVIAMMGEQK
nr:transketolase C-terminal domain-containing protein [Sphingopyxis sp. BSNA05]